MPRRNLASHRKSARPTSAWILGLLALAVVTPLAPAMAGEERDAHAGPRADAEFLARWPARETNDVALELERLAAAIGIDLAPRFVEGRERPDAEAAEVFQAVHRHLGAWLGRELALAQRGVERAPDPIAAFLAEHRAGIERLRERLTAGEAPVWERRPAEPHARPMTNLLGHLSLQKLLLGDALARSREADVAGALEGLEAAWRLNAALREDPTLAAWLIGVTATRMQVGTLRQVGGAPREWASRLRGQDAFAETLDRLRFEGWTWTRVDDPVVLGDIGVVAQALLALGRPVTELCVGDLRTRWERQLQRLGEIESPCRADFEAIETDFRDSIPRWNPLGRVLAPALGNALSRVVRLAIDLELTARLVEIEAAHRSGGARSAERLAQESEGSRVCPEGHYVIERTPDDAVTVSLDIESASLASEGLVLPTRFTLR